jgi:hypothetical protein
MGATQTRHGQRDALDGQIRAQLVDRGELRLDVGPELLLAFGQGETRIARPEFRDRERMEHLGRDRTAQIRIEPEQLEEDRGA